MRHWRGINAARMRLRLPRGTVYLGLLAVSYPGGGQAGGGLIGSALFCRRCVAKKKAPLTGNRR
jgi:hypothetical protein